MSTCSSCHEPILWATHEGNGRPMPFDPEPGAEGTWQLRRSRDGRVARYVGPDDDVRVLSPQPLKLYVSHFATCPNARRHRRTTKP